MGSLECRLKNLEVKMDERHWEIMVMFQKLTISSASGLHGKVTDEVVIRETSRSGPRSMSSSIGNSDPVQNRQQRNQASASNGGKFPLSKNPKVEIPIFRGDEMFLTGCIRLSIYSICTTLQQRTG